MRKALFIATLLFPVLASADFTVLNLPLNTIQASLEEVVDGAEVSEVELRWVRRGQGTNAYIAKLYFTKTLRDERPYFCIASLYPMLKFESRSTGLELRKVVLDVCENTED